MTGVLAYELQLTCDSTFKRDITSLKLPVPEASVESREFTYWRVRTVSRDGHLGSWSSTERTGVNRERDDAGSPARDGGADQDGTR
ncbi:MAG: hypothetical protein HY042_05445 [Spirochaetia bacterium]|nr:hypothetical protein [Spirochaetia bacterium]